ncbi:hypothetical protein MY11210_006769 [Beauveria gryllotalpidicola]
MCEYNASSLLPYERARLARHKHYVPTLNIKPNKEL